MGDLTKAATFSNFDTTHSTITITTDEGLNMWRNKTNTPFSNTTNITNSNEADSIWMLTTLAPGNDSGFLRASLPPRGPSPRLGALDLDVRSSWEASLCGFFMCLMLLLAAAGNIAVIYAVFRFTKLREQVSTGRVTGRVTGCVTGCVSYVINNVHMISL